MMLPRDPAARPLSPRQLQAGGASVRGSGDESSIAPVIVGVAIALVGAYFVFSTDVSTQAEWNARYGKS